MSIRCWGEGSTLTAQSIGVQLKHTTETLEVTRVRQLFLGVMACHILFIGGSNEGFPQQPSVLAWG